MPFEKQQTFPNIDDYYASGGGNWLDIEGNTLGNKLNEAYCRNPLPMGSVILVKTQSSQIGYYVDEKGFRPIKDFAWSRSEQQRLEQEKLQPEKQKSQTAVKKKHSR